MADKMKMAGKGLSTGAKRPRSSRGLTDMANKERKRRTQRAKNIYGDKGMSGYDMKEQIKKEALVQNIIDDDLIMQYGEDAAKARTFMTPQKKTENLSGGGKVRGVGVAQRGFGKAPYSDKLI